MDLIPRPPGEPGRKQTVSARAWIARDQKGGVFQSWVSLGKGRSYKLSTDSRNREKALEFNRAHLLMLLQQRPSRRQSRTEAQLSLLG